MGAFISGENAAGVFLVDITKGKYAQENIAFCPWK